MTRLYKPKKIMNWDGERYSIRGIDGKIGGPYTNAKGAWITADTIWKANLAVYKKRLARRKANAKKKKVAPAFRRTELLGEAAVSAGKGLVKKGFKAVWG